MHLSTERQLTKNLLKIACVCIVFVGLESCQGRDLSLAISPSYSEQTQVADLGGIPNLGNTCYMNAGLQIIAKFYPDVFDGKPGLLAETGRVIVAKIKDDRNAVAREDAERFYDALLHTNQTRFRKNRQEDAEECLTVLLQGSPTSSCSVWKRIISVNEEQTIHNYGGWQRQSDHDSEMLKIYLPNNGKKTMQACFEYTFEDERLVGENRYLDKFLGKVDATPQTRLAIDRESSTLLVVHLVRFLDANLKNTKNVTETLSLTVPARIQYGNDGSDLKYHLQGFIVHSGNDTTHFGHYMAYINQSGQWKQYDDACVQKVTQEDTEEAAQQAYLYFYRRSAS